MSRRIVFLFLLCGLVSLPLAPAIRAQSARFDAARVAELLPSNGILNNSISNLHAQGDSLWTGPFLNLTTDGGQSWQVADTDSLGGSANRVFSIDVEGLVIWVGLGYNDTSSGDGVQSAAGFLVSTDGGMTFDYRFPQLDAPGDDQITYGVSTLGALPVIVPQQSPPFDIDYDPVHDQVWVAGWASGVRRSSDGGRTWQRVVLPPDDLDAIQPDEPYDFTVEPQRGSMGELNHMGFAVLVDESGTVWAGTPKGINRSTDGGVSWQRFSANGTSNALTGSWVISIEEQPLPGPNAIWMATWNAGEAGEDGQFGITVTRDGGERFEKVLLGERVYDFAFDGTTVYAAGESGLFITDDGGTSWRTVRDFRDPLRSERVLRPDTPVFSVETTRNALWAGTGDGLVKSLNGGLTWELFRVEVPLNPETPTDRVPRVETFAYPNPFSAAADRFIRIRFEAPRTSGVDLRIFDFGMNLVRNLSDTRQDDGIREVLWDGTDDGGLRIANGTYFYEVKAGGETFWGKILVIE